jgi:osmotically-inducible protein OsmY
MYGECINDPALYDAVLNLESMSLPAACATLAAMVQQPEFQPTRAARAAYSDFLLACRVKLAFLLDPEAKQLALEATARDGVVELTGRAPLFADGSTGETVARIARGVEGVQEVHLKLEWYDPYP